MAKLLVAVISIATLGYLGYYAMYKTRVEKAEDRVAHAPKRQLDNVREKAKTFEVEDQQRFNEMEKKAE